MTKMGTRPVARRDTPLSPPGEMSRRRLLLAYVAAGGAGPALLIAGLVKHRRPVAIAGASGLAVAAALHVARPRWGAPDVLGELKANPFKPTHSPKADDDDPAE